MNEEQLVYLCKRCAKKAQNNCEHFEIVSEFENVGDDYECDFCGSLGALIECIIA